MRIANTLLPLLLIIALAESAIATTWDIAADWSIANGNPNGAWGYGYVTSVGSSFIPYTTGIYSVELTRSAWIADGTGELSSTAKLMSDQPQQWGDSQYIEPYQVMMHPGSSGQLAVFRWTSPVSAALDVRVKFSGQSLVGTTADAHVMQNGAEIWTAQIDGFAGRAALGYSDSFGPSPVATFETDLLVEPGDTLDFLLGTGGNGYTNDMTGVSITITTTAEGPATVSGTVTADTTGHPPIEGATVRVTDGLEKTQTGSDGKYSLTLEPGSHQIEVSYPAAVTQYAAVSVAHGQTVVADFDLAPRSTSELTTSRLGSVRAAPDGAYVILTEPKVATVASATFVDGSYYVEDDDRVCGIRVLPDTLSPAVSFGDRLMLEGVLDTDAAGERLLRASVVTLAPAGPALAPLLLNGKALSAAVGLDPTGLLVRACGVVTAKSSDGGWFYLDDGVAAADTSGQAGVRVLLSGLTSMSGSPPVGRHAIVTGLVGRALVGDSSVRVIRPRSQADIVTLPDTTSEMTKRDNWLAMNLGQELVQIPFSFVYNGEPSAQFLSGWARHYTSTVLDDGRTQRTITCTDQTTGLQVRCEAIVYNDYPTVEWKLFLKNTSTADTPIIESILPLDIALDRGSDSEFVLHHNQGTPYSTSDYQPFDTVLAPSSTRRLGAAGGRPMNTDMPYYNLEWAGQGIIIAVGWTGQSESHWIRDAGSLLRITAGQEQTHFRLHPGEEVRTPMIVLQFWNDASPEVSIPGGMGRVHAQNVWRRWMIEHNLPRPGGQPFPPIISMAACDFFPNLMSSISDELTILDGCVYYGLDADYWWRDAGWYPCGDGWWNTGSWWPDPARYPNGLRELSDRAHSYGMKQTVWFEPERVTAGSWLATNHPEWLLGGTLLNLGNPDAWDWLVNYMDQFLTDQHIDMYRQDFNMDPLGYWRGNDAPDRQGITEIRHVEGLYAYWDELKRRHPDMPFDNCASGGRRNDIEMMRRGVPLSKTDYAGGTTSSQCQFYGIASWLPYFGAGTMAYDLYTMRSNIAPWSASAWDTRNPNNNYALVRKYLAECRLVAPYYWGDFYPLTAYSLDSSVWMAWQFNLPESGSGLVQAFRRENAASASATYKLYDLIPEATYELINLDSAGSTQATGHQLMENGITFNLTSRPWAGIITYRRL